MIANSTEPAPYLVSATADDEIIAQAIAILERRLRRPGVQLSDPASVRDYLRLKHAAHQQDHEVFAVTFLDAQHCVIEHREMFRGTLTQTSVYPREIARAAIDLRANAVILSHNHPSGDAEPSRADEALTKTLKSALSMLDVRVLDHFVIGARRAVSFAEQGLL